jgi:hypothetical protein
MGNTGQMALTDDFGEECNPFIAMPPLEVRLSWTPWLRGPLYPRPERLRDLSLPLSERR